MGADGAGDGRAPENSRLIGHKTMKDARDVIISPIISEKSHIDLQSNKYYFKVAKTATKTDIENAVKKLFDVEVESVNILNKRAEKKNYGRFKGFSAAWKKAIVTVRKDQKIAGFFEGM